MGRMMRDIALDTPWQTVGAYAGEPQGDDAGATDLREKAGA